MKKAELKKTAQETTQVQAAAVPLAGKKADADPFGNSYLQGNPLDSCMVFLKPLLEFSPKTLEVQILGARVYTHKSKSLFSVVLSTCSRSMIREIPLGLPVYQESPCFGAIFGCRFQGHRRAIPKLGQ